MSTTTCPLGSAPAIRPYAMFGRVCYAPDPEPTPPTPDPKPAAKIELTADELDAKIAAALAADRAEAKRIADEKQADADRKTAEEQGKWEKIAKDAELERDTLKAANAERDRHDTIRAAVSEAAKGKEGYPADLFDKYVTGPLIVTLAKDAKLDAIKAAAKEAVEQYVTDNPRQPKGSAGAPPVPRGRVPAGRQPIQRPSTAGVASSRF